MRTKDNESGERMEKKYNKKHALDIFNEIKIHVYAQPLSL